MGSVGQANTLVPQVVSSDFFFALIESKVEHRFGGLWTLFGVWENLQAYALGGYDGQDSKALMWAWKKTLKFKVSEH